MADQKYLGSEGLIRLIAQVQSRFAKLGHSHNVLDIEDYIVDDALSSTSTNPVQNKVIQNELNVLTDSIADLSETASVNYNESIIGLSIDGQVITYIKGDGTSHTIITQDTDTTYSLGTDEVTGLTKLYATVGSAEDGTMTQKAIKTELDKKVGVMVDDSMDTLIFTI